MAIQRTYIFILFALLVGKGDGQWKKSPKDVLRHDIRIYKKITEKIKREFEDFYNEYSHEPINDYFLEEIDYVESKIEKFDPEIKIQGNRDLTSNENHTRDDKHHNVHDKIYSNNMAPINSKMNHFPLTSTTNANITWPKFEEILSAIGRQYDWKNDRWIKVKSKMKDKEKKSPYKLKYNTDHQKHNFRYRIVKLNKVKSKRKIVIAVTAVR